MKKSLFVFAMFSVLALAGCAKENPKDDRPEDAQLLVKLDMGKAVTSRTVINPASEDPETFTLANNMLFIVGASGDVLDVVSTGLTKDVLTGDGYTYAKRVSRSSKLLFLSNIRTQDYTALSSVKTLDELKKYYLSLENYSTLPESPVLSNSDGKPAELGTPDENNVVTATVTISPANARLELVSVQGGEDTDGRRITSFRVRGVYVDDFFPRLNVLSEAFGEDGKLTEKLSIGSDVTLFNTVQGKYNLRDNGTWPSVAAVYPVLPAASPDVAGTPAVTELWGYSVPAKGAPRLIVEVDQVKYTTDEGVTENAELADNTYYLTVTGYKTAQGGDLTNFERGHVYRIGTPSNPFVFTLKDMGTVPNPPNLTLVAKVSVTGWVVDLPTAKL